MYLYIYFILFLFLIFNLWLMRWNFHLAKPLGTSLPLSKVHCLSLCLILRCAQPGYAFVLNFGVFFTLNQFTPILFCVSSLTCHQPMRFSFRDFMSFSFINRNTYFLFLFLSSRVKKHICILWNPNISFNNNNNNNNNNNVREWRFLHFGNIIGKLFFV